MVDRPPNQIEQKRRRLTIEALADVDAGRVVDHRAVWDWAGSLDSDTRVAAPVWHTREDR